MDGNLIDNKALIDKLVLYNISILDVKSLENLIREGLVTITNSELKYITYEGQEFSTLKIIDNEFGKLSAGAKVIQGNKVIYTILELNVKGVYGNLICKNVDEYISYILEVEELIAQKYGVVLSTANAKIKQIEINRTFKLESSFNNYHRAINVIMHNLPKRYCRQATYQTVEGSVPRYETYYATTKRSSNTNHYTMVKMYDKTKALANTVFLDESYMRIEYTICGAEKIRQAFGTNELALVTDDEINSWFNRQVSVMIVEPVKKWKAQRDKKILRLMKNQRKNDIKHWQVNVLRLLASEEIETNTVVVLGIDELCSLVNKLDISSKRKRDVKKNIRNQAMKYEPCFCNEDDKKLDELLCKLTAVATE